jgi:hypothetical protein
MAGTIWIPGAERITPSLPGGEITSDAPPRVVWHTTQNPSGDPHQWSNVIGTLRSKNAEPQVIYDPVSDRLGQFIPLNLSGRALKNDGATKTNRVGKVCIQVEVIAYAEKPFTTYWKPGPNFRALMAAIRSWGIPDAWPSGPPPSFIASPPHNVPEDERSRTIWLGKGGHYGHSHVPANNHGDPGAINTSALFAAGKATTPTPATPPTLPAEAKDVTITAACIKRLANDHLGVNGACLVDNQQVMNIAVYFNPAMAATTRPYFWKMCVDGNWAEAGKMMTYAVKIIQAQAKLPQDGIFGPKTTAFLATRGYTIK